MQGMSRAGSRQNLRQLQYNITSQSLSRQDGRFNERASRTAACPQGYRGPFPYHENAIGTWNASSLQPDTVLSIATVSAVSVLSYTASPISNDL
jgi:hypothetical protein